MRELTSYQKEALRGMGKYRMALLLWRRQGGKTTAVAWWILKRLLKHPGKLITFVSASMSVGSEIPFRTSEIFNDLLDKLRDLSPKDSLEISSNGEGLDDESLVQLFKQGRLEVHIRHSATSTSRLKVIAPNVATARGYSGDVIMDEIGFIPDFKALFEAVEPIISRDPTFRLYMATTPPNDDSHFSFDLAAPEPGMTFDASATGTWYTSQAGIPVHRVDAWDADAAGVPLYDKMTGAPLSPEAHRAQALDRDAWDRNYGLQWLTGGTSAISLAALSSAQELGAKLGCVAAQNEIPAGWATSMTDQPWALGYDPATTEKKTSNPSGLVVMQQVGPRQYAERLVLRFKTADDLEAKAHLREVLEAATTASGCRPKRICIDSSNERYFAVSVKREFSRYGTVTLVVSGETLDVHGARMSYKAYLGNEYANAFEDGQLAIPPDRWVKEDHRLMKKVKGSFDNELDSAGNHGDTADAGKLALFGLTKRGGPVQAEAISAGNAARGRKVYAV